MSSTLKFSVVPVTLFAQNCSIIWCSKTMKAAVIDPGGQIDLIAEEITKNGVTLEKILLTHGHLDHVGGAADLAKQYGVPIEGPMSEDNFLLRTIEEQGRNYGLSGCKSCKPDLWLKHGDQVTIGEQILEVYHCPGHTPGHVVFFHRAEKLAFVGDVLFNGSIGRTDFPRGDYDTLIESITQRLWPLGKDVTFISGHGPASTFGEERRSNPYVSDMALGR